MPRFSLPMTRILLFFAGVVVLLLPQASVLRGATKHSGGTSCCARGEVIVKLKRAGTAGLEGLAEQVIERAAPVRIEPLVPEVLTSAASARRFDRVFVLKFAGDLDVEAYAAELNASGLVDYAEPNYLIRPGSESLPDDPGFGEQWGLRNLGLSVGGFPATLDADIRALGAWAITTGSPDVIVALPDTGVDITHPDLAPNIYTNPDEIPDNGVDDDKNGLVDDVHGFNFADNDNDVSDVMGHGTLMAGIIAGITNNRVGISGLSQCKVLPIRFFRRTGSDVVDIEGTVADAARSILYAIDVGASIINASWTTLLNPLQVPEQSARALEDAIRAADDAGVLVVTIAGNDATNIDFRPVYPASYKLSNEIVVAASDFTDSIWHVYGKPSSIKSSYGAETVDLTAPGVLVFTTTARGDCLLCSESEDDEDWYRYTDGTSAAAAFVSGAASLVKSHYPESNAILLKRRILEGVDVRESLQAFVAGSGRLNAERALTIQLKISQPIITKLKYKIGAERLLIFGEGIEPGAMAVIGKKAYHIKPKGVKFVAGIPPTELPVGTTVEVIVRNPDGGTSLPGTITR